MGAKANQIKGICIWLAINQHKIRLDMAITMVFPLANQGVVMKPFRQRRIRGQQGDNFDQIVIQRLAVTAFLFSLVVVFEGAGSINRPH